MELLLTAIAAGLLVGLAYCLVKVRVREPSVFALIGVVVMLLGQITAYVYPFGVGLLLGLVYDIFGEGRLRLACPSRDPRTSGVRSLRT